MHLRFLNFKLIESESEVIQSCPTVWDPMDCSLSGSSIHGEYWSGLPFPSPGDLPDPGIKPRSPTLQPDDMPSEPPVGSPEVVKIAQQVPFTQFPQLVTFSVFVTEYQG